MTINNLTYTIFRPAGNNTALVDRVVTNSGLRKQINDAIQRENPMVEQVGFINNKKGKYQLQMAGNEFCGNATRCAAYFFLQGKVGEVTISVSGAKRKLKAGIDNRKNTWTQIPVYSSPNKIQKTNIGQIVKMEGITHVVVNQKNKTLNRQQTKNKAKKILERYDFLNTVEASGVIFVTRLGQNIEIEPVVWVKNIKTLYYETACASGTAAVGLVETLSRKKSIKNMEILQPSGMFISVSVKYKQKKFYECTISGKVQILQQKAILNIDD